MAKRSIIMVNLKEIFRRNNNNYVILKFECGLTKPKKN